MAEKLLEVNNWLEEIGIAACDFEVNEETVGILHKLKERSEAATRDAVALTNHLKSKTEEFRMKASREEWILRQFEFPIHELLNAKSGLNVLADVAVILDVEDCRESLHTSCMTAMSDFVMERANMDAIRAEDRAKKAHLQARVGKMVQRANELSRVVEAVENQAIPEVKERNIMFFKAKACQYQKEIKQTEDELVVRGVDSSISLENLKAKHKAFQELQAKLQEVNSELSKYNNLPLDITLARVKVTEAKMELEKLRSQFDEKLRFLHLS